MRKQSETCNVFTISTADGVAEGVETDCFDGAEGVGIEECGSGADVTLGNRFPRDSTTF